MFYRLTLVLILACCTATADAQTFVNRLQKKTAGQGQITVTHDAAIDALVNGPATATPQKPARTEKPAAPAAPAAAPGKGKTAGTNSVTKTESPAEAPDMHKKVMGRSYKVDGYRVQAYAGGNTRRDRQAAERTGSSIKASFPNEPIYVHFYSPRWICRVGNYRTYEEAHRMLLAIQKLGYKQASIVKGKITVQY